MASNNNITNDTNDPIIATGNSRMNISSRPNKSTSSSSSRLAIPPGNASTSPNHNGNPLASSSYDNMTFLKDYLTRLIDIPSMDLQSAIDQMKTLCTLTPQRVYKTSYYRKQTKNHWARDDPAFLFLQILFLAVSCVAYCIAFRSPSLVSAMLSFGFKSIVVNYVGGGIVVASVGRGVANGYLTVKGGNTNHVKQRVEWLYAFDIHCNAFFPLFLILYVGHFFILPIVLGKSFMALIISNTLFAAAFSWYFYITHLGYRALPFLSNTEVFLFPIVAVLALYAFNLIGYPFGLGWNASRIVAYLYFE